jgi:hypothetical protein
MTIITASGSSTSPDIESDPLGYISWVGEQFIELNERLRLHATVIRDLIHENQKLHDRVATLEAVGRLEVNRRDEDQMSNNLPKPQLH